MADPTPPRRRPLLLLVEDDEDTTSLLTAVLTGGGFLVRAAGNGDAALRWLGQVTPDVVLLDLSMPTMDGATFVQEMRAHRANAAAIVICSAMPDCQSVAAQLGVRHVIEKPFVTEDLLRVLRRALEENQIEQEHRRRRFTPAGVAKKP
jgi:CheY-like chemotaxis protein